MTKRPLLLALLVLAACDNTAHEKAKADSAATALKVEQQATAKHIADSVRAADSKRRADSIAAEQARPKTLEVFNTTGVTVPAGGSQSYAFQLAGTGKCALRGRVEATEGGNKDVRVYIMPADEFTNWKNSPQGRAHANFEGEQQSVTSFDQQLPSPGTYRVVISNRFSVMTNKTVHGQASVTCVGGPEPRVVREGE